MGKICLCYNTPAFPRTFKSTLCQMGGGWEGHFQHLEKGARTRSCGLAHVHRNAHHHPHKHSWGVCVKKRFLLSGIMWGEQLQHMISKHWKEVFGSCKHTLGAPRHMHMVGGALSLQQKEMKCTAGRESVVPDGEKLQSTRKPPTHPG